MKNSDLLLALTAIILLSCPVHASWYNDSWPYRIEVIPNASQVAGNSSNFPLLVRLPSDSLLAGIAQSDGDDILFTNLSGSKLDHEIESFNGSTGELAAWVRLPLISNTSNNTIYMYYGNPSAPSQENMTGTW